MVRLSIKTLVGLYIKETLAKERMVSVGLEKTSYNKFFKHLTVLHGILETLCKSERTYITETYCGEIERRTSDLCSAVKEFRITE